MFELSNLPQPILRYGVGLWRRRWVIVAVAWAVALLGWFVIWLLPDQYQSRAQVFVQTETILDPVMTGVTARPNYDRRVEVMTLQVLSRPNVQEVIYRAGLDKEIDAKTPAERQAQLEGLINYITGRIQIDSPRPMYFDITFKYGDPLMAREIVDAVLNLFIEQDLGASLTESQEARKRLEAQIANFDAALTQREREVAEFRQRNASELSVIEGNARRRGQIETDLSRLADELSLAKRRVTTLRTLLSTTPRQSSGNELDELLVELAALRSQYEDSYPDIQALQARIEELSAGSDNRLPSNPEYRRVENDLRAARDSVASIEQRQDDLRTELEALTFTIGQAPAVQAELQRIERDYEQTRKSYEELLQRRDRLALTESLGAGGQGVEYQVFERPMASVIPVGPPRLLFILVALCMAIGAGAALAALLTYLEKTFSQSSELQTAFGLPVLGAISEVHSQDVKRAWRKDVVRLAGAFAALLALGCLYTYWQVWQLPETVGETPPAATINEKEAHAATEGDKTAGEHVEEKWSWA